MITQNILSIKDARMPDLKKLYVIFILAVAVKVALALFDNSHRLSDHDTRIRKLEIQ